MGVRNITVSTDRVEIPSRAVKRGRGYLASPFDALFKDGPTPEGEAYQVEVPEDETAVTFRQAVISELQRAAAHHNKYRSTGPALGPHTAMGQDGKVIYVWLVNREGE